MCTVHLYRVYRSFWINEKHSVFKWIFTCLASAVISFRVYRNRNDLLLMHNRWDFIPNKFFGIFGQKTVRYQSISIEFSVAGWNTEFFFCRNVKTQMKLYDVRKIWKMKNLEFKYTKIRKLRKNPDYLFIFNGDYTNVFTSEQIFFRASCDES